MVPLEKEQRSLVLSEGDFFEVPANFQRTCFQFAGIIIVCKERFGKGLKKISIKDGKLAGAHRISFVCACGSEKL